MAARRPTMARARAAIATALLLLLLSWAAGLVGFVLRGPAGQSLLDLAVVVAVVATAVVFVLVAWPRLEGRVEGRAPQLVRCRRCATTFTPALRSSEAVCPTCGHRGRFGP